MPQFPEHLRASSTPKLLPENFLVPTHQLIANKQPKPPTLEERNKQASLTLSLKYDALNQLFVQAEQQLRSLKPPHAVWFPYAHRSYDYGVHFCDLIGLDKYNDAWRLLHATDNSENEEGYENITPIVECPVNVRIEAAKVVGRLHEEIVKAKEAYTSQVDEAINELKEALKLSNAK
jgi:hypothetical protein